MKAAIFVLVLAFYELSFGQSIPFGQLGSPFTYINIDLVWSVHGDNLPRKLWVYRVLPSQISPAAVSNLVALGSFSDKDRKTIPEKPHTISYADQTGKRWLLINTDWSFVQYGNADAHNMQDGEGVPDEQHAFTAATNWFQKLGIDSSQLMRNPHASAPRDYGGVETTVLYKKSGGDAFATNISMHSIAFKRALDGVEVSGGVARGGYMMEFGHHQEIYRIMLSWRNYKRDKQYRTAKPKALLDWIRGGRAVWYSPPDSPDIDWPSASKMVITKATPFYYSDAYGLADKPQTKMFPFVELEARVETSHTNSIIFLDCPVIDGSKNSIVTTHPPTRRTPANIARRGPSFFIGKPAVQIPNWDWRGTTKTFLRFWC